MVRAGAHGVPLFTDDAIQSIFDHSRGIPRNINNICDGCLLLGASWGLTTIDKTIVTRAIDYIEGTHVRPAPPPVPPSAEPVGQPAHAAQLQVKEDLVARVTVDYLAAGGRDKQPQKREDTRKGSNLKVFVIIAVIMFILGIILALSFDFRAVIKSLADFFARMALH
jgi:hypothetical protein